MGADQQSEAANNRSKQECKLPYHVLQETFPCSRPNCMAVLCQNCLAATSDKGERYCMLCAFDLHKCESEETPEGSSGQITREFT
jgi:hypothetical protein